MLLVITAIASIAVIEPFVGLNSPERLVLLSGLLSLLLELNIGLQKKCNSIYKTDKKESLQPDIATIAREKQ